MVDWELEVGNNEEGNGEELGNSAELGIQWRIGECEDLGY